MWCQNKKRERWRGRERERERASERERERAGVCNGHRHVATASLTRRLGDSVTRRPCWGPSRPESRRENSLSRLASLSALHRDARPGRVGARGKGDTHRVDHHAARAGASHRTASAVHAFLFFDKVTAEEGKRERARNRGVSGAAYRMALRSAPRR